MVERSELAVEPLSTAIGAEIRGVDTRRLSDRQFDVIERAWHEHLVLLFRDQSIDPDDQLAFSRRFGAGLSEFLHEPNSILTRRRIRDAVQKALTRYEPRIRLQGVEVTPDGERDERVRIQIAYQVLRTGTPGALSIAMTLGG